MLHPRTAPGRPAAGGCGPTTVGARPPAAGTPGAALEPRPGGAARSGPVVIGGFDGNESPPFVRRQTFENSPIAWRIGPVPVLTIVGAIGTVFVIPLMYRLTRDTAYSPNLTSTVGTRRSRSSTSGPRGHQYPPVGRGGEGRVSRQRSGAGGGYVGGPRARPRLGPGRRATGPAGGMLAGVEWTVHGEVTAS